MKEAAKEFKWTLNYGSIAMMWRGGCIIRRFVDSLISDLLILTSFTVDIT